VIWLAYPGESVTIDFAATGANEVELFDMDGENIWLEGFTIRRTQCLGYRFDGRDQQFGVVVRWFTGQEMINGSGSSNCSYLLWDSIPDGPSYHDTLQLSNFLDSASASCAIKTYSTLEPLFETSFYGESADNEAMLALKVLASASTVRANYFDGNAPTGIGGNMNDDPLGSYGVTSGEIYHNLCLGSGTGTQEGCLTLGVSKIDIGPQWYVYRNTFLGKINISNLVTADGPYTFSDNVLLNSQAASGSCPAKYTCHSVTDYTRLVDNADNVKGLDDGSVANTTTGELVGSSRTNYLGVAGFELAVTTRHFSPRLNLIRSSLPQHTEELN